MTGSKGNISAVDVVVLGGGAAGLMCGIEAGKRGRKVVVLERSPSVGEKIRISGGGRCNFTNRIVTSGNYISANPRFCTSALARYSPEDFIGLVRKHAIPFHEKKLGQLFCDESAQRIVDMLLQECGNAGVSVLTGQTVIDVEKGEGFRIVTKQDEFAASSLVVATGGLSVPKIGATDFGFRIARQFGLSIVSPKPALVPFIAGQGERKLCENLSGISIGVKVSCNGQSFHENLLFTHRGFSGPAVLQISSYWNPGDQLLINLLPEDDMNVLIEKNRQSNRAPASLLHDRLPRRFVQEWCPLHVPDRPLTQCSARELRDVPDKLHRWRVVPDGTEGYAKAEATAGGVDTRELSSKTMESARVKGLYFIGEVVDVTGQLGGYNFQWAWASGFAAGQFV